MVPTQAAIIIRHAQSVCVENTSNKVEPTFSFNPVDVRHEFLNVVGFAVLIIDVERMLVGVDDDQRFGHPENSHRVFVADDVVELAIDRVLHQHRPACGFFSRGDENGADHFSMDPKRRSMAARNPSGWIDLLGRESVEVEFVQDHAVATTADRSLQVGERRRVDNSS